MTATLLSQTGKITREELALVPTPPGTETHKTIPHVEVVNALVETLGFRHIGVMRVKAGLKRQRFRRFCSQRKPAIGQDAVPTLQQFLNHPA